MTLDFFYSILKPRSGTPVLAQPNFMGVEPMVSFLLEPALTGLWLEKVNIQIHLF